jgi:hypothetical protein
MPARFRLSFPDLLLLNFVCAKVVGAIELACE